MHLALFVILLVIGTGLAHQLVMSAIPEGTPRHIMLIALAAGAGLLLFDRIVRAEMPSQPSIAQTR